MSFKLGELIFCCFYIGPDDCEFDHDKMCHWKADDNRYKWIRWTGVTGSSGTGPSGDHSSGSGNSIECIKGKATILLLWPVIYNP